MSDTGIPYLSPMIPGREFRQRRQALRNDVFRKVVEQATRMRDPRDVLFEVYLAGLFHGAAIIWKNPETLALIQEVVAPEPPPAVSASARRTVDRITIKRRGRPRKADK